MKCKKCGCELSHEQMYCSNCGAKKMINKKTVCIVSLIGVLTSIIIVLCIISLLNLSNNKIQHSRTAEELAVDFVKAFHESNDELLEDVVSDYFCINFKRNYGLDDENCATKEEFITILKQFFVFQNDIKILECKATDVMNNPNEDSLSSRPWNVISKSDRLQETKILEVTFEYLNLDHRGETWIIYCGKLNNEWIVIEFMKL